MTAASSPLSPVLRQAFAKGKTFNPQGAEVALHSNVAEAEAVALYEVVRQLKPTVSLEVGFAQGVSASAILQAIADNGVGHHHVMDPFQAAFEDCGVEMVRRAGHQQWATFHRKFAEEVIPHLPEIGFAFIDASHLFDLTLCEFVLTDKKLKVGGVVAFHDMWMPSQQALIRYILANRKYRVLSPSKIAPLPAPRRSMIKSTLRNACRSLPRSDQIFSHQFLQPWDELQLHNLVFLEKLEPDQRDWKFHSSF